MGLVRWIVGLGTKTGRLGEIAITKVGERICDGNTWTSDARSRAVVRGVCKDAVVVESWLT